MNEELERVRAAIGARNPVTVLPVGVTVHDRLQRDSLITAIAAGNAASRVELTFVSGGVLLERFIPGVHCFNGSRNWRLTD